MIIMIVVVVVLVEKKKTMIMVDTCYEYVSLEVVMITMV